MPTEKIPRTRTIKKTTGISTPEVKLQEHKEAKQYTRNNERLTLGGFIRILFAVGLIIGAFFLGVRMGFGEFKSSLCNTSLGENCQ